MIISHRHRYIYLKSRKTASTSLEIALSKYAGPTDILTEISPEDEKTRLQLGYAGAQNFHLPFTKYTRKDWRDLFVRRRRAMFTNHTPAKRIKRLIPESIWNDYFKFTIERNPYDKAISAYFWRTRDMDPRPSVVSFLEEVDEKRICNFDIYSIKDQVVADYVGRYESLAESVEEIRKRIGFDGPLELPHAKSQFRPDAKSYREMLTPEARALVEKICAKEIAAFGYTFD